jgi:uncharacterized damage-inducible protein DinB
VRRDPASLYAIPGRKYDFSLRWLLQHVITHEAYHGGQAALLKLQFQAQRRD